MKGKLHMCKKIIACLTMLTIFALTGCNKAKTKDIPAETVVPIVENATEENIEEQLGNSTNTEKNKDSGITADNYENSKFAGYNGQISFYYDEDGSVLYYKWFITEKNEKKAKEIYSDVCEALAGSYGDGEENNSAASGLYTTSFTNEEQQITAQMQKANDNGYEISYIVVG